MKQQRQRTSPKMRHFIHDVLACLLAGLFTLFAFILANRLYDGLFVATVGASAYIVFLLPQSESARPANCLGSYGIGIVIGLLCALLLHIFPVQNHFIVLFYFLPVFLTALLMQCLHLPHPPAVALAVSVTLTPEPLLLALVSAITIAAMVLTKQVYFYISDRFIQPWAAKQRQTRSS